VVENSLIYSNRTTNAGYSPQSAGIDLWGGEVVNCTIAYNETANAASGGGIYWHGGGTVTNCIVYFNTAGGVANDYDGDPATNKIAYSCASDVTDGFQGNITADPEMTALNPADLLNQDFQLISGSPCIDTGVNLASITNDYILAFRPFDGDAVPGAIHDMGAYEFSGAAPAPAAGIVVTIR